MANIFQQARAPEEVSRAVTTISYVIVWLLAIWSPLYESPVPPEAVAIAGVAPDVAQKMSCLLDNVVPFAEPSIPDANTHFPFTDPSVALFPIASEYRPPATHELPSAPDANPVVEQYRPAAYEPCPVVMFPGPLDAPEFPTGTSDTGILAPETATAV